MKNKLLILSFFVSSFYLPSLMAYEIGLGARSMGQVVELGKRLGGSFNVRIAVASDYESGDVEYASSEEIEVESVLSGDKGLWNVSHSSLLFDYHPWQGTFRLTIGLTDNSVSWAVENTNVNAFTFNDKTFNSDIVESTELQVQFTDGVSPYVGLGWATGFDKVKGFSFNGDIGVLGTSGFVILFDASCIGTRVDSNDCKEVKQNVKEELKTLNAEEKINLLPLLGLGVSYRF
jgi:hypothetical protein